MTSQESEEKSKKGAAEVEDRVGDIFKGLCESVKGEMAANKSTLEVMILNEVREREAKDEELLHHMEKDKVQIRDDFDQKYKLQEQQRAGEQPGGWLLVVIIVSSYHKSQCTFLRA